MKIPFYKKISLSKLLPKNTTHSSSPGTIKYIWKKRSSKVKMDIINYNETNFSEKKISKIEDSILLKDDKSITWLNVMGVHNEALIHEIGEKYNIHPLVLEDITNTTKRPKIEEYDDYLYIIVKMIYFSKKTKEVEVEQVSLIVGSNYVITFHEKESDILDWVKNRLRTFKGKIRKLWSDYLMYAIIDSIVDQYFYVIEQISENIEGLEEELMLWSGQELLNKIYSLKKEIVFLKKSVWPLREVVNTLQHGENKLINEYTFIFLRDLYDHTIQVIETVETFRDLISWMLDLYLSTVSNKMNEIMKVLTIFGTIFIPLTFIAWVYWMNFEHMPELTGERSYYIWWIIIIFIVITILLLFKRKKWI